jgi:diguanylate cyclase (GGDEF)-like protein
VLNRARVAEHPKNAVLSNLSVTAHKLLTYVDPVTPETDNDAVLARFAETGNLHSIPVVENGKPVGMINRYSFIDCFAQPFRRELLGKKPCQQMMQTPLLVEKDTPVQELSQFLTETEGRHFADGFLITEGGRYLGVGTSQSLLRVITQMQIESARYANPLTMLPGNVPINEQIERLLGDSEPFYACYCDLDNFKPFNDVYGYSKGDELIQMTGRILHHACDLKLDFLGHIGGDDFILLMRSPDWQKRCNDALRSFAELSSSLLSDEHRWRGGYESEDRQGRIIFHPSPALSIGAVHIDPRRFESHHEVSAASARAKKMAKQIRGNSLFIEPRRQGAVLMPVD